MSKFISSTMVLVAAACFGSAAQASVLTFEDRPNGPAFFLADYNGFRFGTNNIATTAWFSTDQASPFYTPSSPTHYIATDFNLYDNTNPSQGAQAITSTVDFIFNGAFFSGTDRIFYELYNDNVLVFTSAQSAALNNTPLFVASGFFGLVDSVVVFGRQGFYALDDFTYNVRAVAEPGSYALVMAGLLAAGVVSRKKQLV